MSMILALALRPNDAHIAALDRLYAGYMAMYSGISIVVPPDTDPAHVAALAKHERVRVLLGSTGRENRRFRTLEHALTFDDVAYVHYCDGDHALVRFERYPDDWRRCVDAIPTADCLVIGRTPDVLASYPAALRDTERIINTVATHLLGQDTDLGSGARGFSRRVVQHILAHDTAASHPIAVDSAWPIMLHRAGFAVDTFWSNGAIYDVPNEATRQVLESAGQWAKRVDIAHKIIAAGIAAHEGRYPGEAHDG